jgi:hypothetical protein
MLVTESLLLMIESSLLVELNDEAMESLWDDARGVLKEFASSRCFANGFVQFARCIFLRLLSDRPLDVFECVALPTFGASYFVLGLRLRDDFYRDFAARAQQEFLGHSSYLDLSGACPKTRH